jgi:hypothetical protein
MNDIPFTARLDCAAKELSRKGQNDQSCGCITSVVAEGCDKRRPPLPIAALTATVKPNYTEQG